MDREKKQKSLFDFLGEDPREAEERASLFPGTDPMFVEQYKTFCARFDYRAGVLGHKVIAVTSAIAGEGKTVSSMNLAANLASSRRKKVLLVDVDLRKSDLAKGMRIAPVPGLTEFLAGAVELPGILRESAAPGLDVITGGMRVPAPWEMITGERFRSFLGEMRQLYDVILLDAPPIIPVSDTLTLRDLVDSFIVVYRLGFTPHQLFRQCREEIGEKKLLGVLLNGAPPQSERYYQRYYGRYYKKSAPVPNTTPS